MEQQEKAIVEAERTVSKQMLEKKFLVKVDQELINEQIGTGVVCCNDLAYGFRRIYLFAEYSIMIPEHFDLMRTEFIKRKYPSEYRPDIVYTNESSTVNITFCKTDEEVGRGELERYISNVFHSMRKLYGSESVLAYEMMMTDGLNVGYFDVVTKGFDTEIYNLIFHFAGQGRIVRGALNCPKDEADLWKKLMIGMISSLQVKERKL